jgi:hypothetical protein
MTSNQTFAGMIADWNAKECQHSDCDNAICEACSELHGAASEAQAIETRLRGLVTTWREAAFAYHAQAEANRSFGQGALQNTVYCGAYQNCADSLEAILGPKQAGERTNEIQHARSES